MTNTTNISISKSEDLKTKADPLFIHQSLRESHIPFDTSLYQPNAETIAAMLEGKRIAKDPSVKGYADLDELFAELKCDE